MGYRVNKTPGKVAFLYARYYYDYANLWHTRKQHQFSTYLLTRSMETRYMVPKLGRKQPDVAKRGRKSDPDLWWLLSHFWKKCVLLKSTLNYFSSKTNLLFNRIQSVLIALIPRSMWVLGRIWTKRLTLFQNGRIDVHGLIDCTSSHFVPWCFLDLQLVKARHENLVPFCPGSAL